jgi:hypothetical protein
MRINLGLLRFSRFLRKKRKRIEIRIKNAGKKIEHE